MSHSPHSSLRGFWSWRIGLSACEVHREGLGERVASWVRHLGYETTVTEDGAQTLAWVEKRVFAAHLLDSRLVAETGERVWRRVRPIVGRRLVLMARQPRSDLFFEALRVGVGALLPLPPREATVRAALRAATGAPPPGPDRR